MKKKFKIILASVLCLGVIIIGGAVAFLASESDQFDNTFIVGTVDAELIEVFNGEELTGGNSQTTSVPCTPGTTIDKKAYVKFTGNGRAFAYIRVDVPIDLCDQIVDENGALTGETANAVTLNLDDVGLSRENKWYYLNTAYGTTKEDEGIVSYYFYYIGYLDNENPQTLTSPIDSVSIANMLIRNDDVGKNYDITVTAYALQCNDPNALPTKVWHDSGLKF